MKKQLVSISAITLIAHLAAFCKLLLTARIFGVGPELDGYNLGFVLPTMVSGVLAGILQTGLFPVYAKLRVQGDSKRLERFESLMFLLLAMLGGAIAAAVAIGANVLSGVLARDATEAVRQWTAFVLPWAASAILLNLMGEYLGYLLALRDRFIIAASAPIANAAVGATLLMVWPEGRLLSLILGTLLGLFLQVTICLAGAQWAGSRPLGGWPAIKVFLPELTRLVRLGGWILPGVVFANFTATLPPVLISSYGDGAISAFGYAQRLHMSAVQVLVMSISTVLLAHFSDLVARGEWAVLRKLLFKAGWVSALVGFGGWFAVYLVGNPVLSYIFGYGRFDSAAVTRVVTQWAWLTFGLAPALFGNILAKCLQAMTRPRLLSMLAGLGLAALIGCNAALGSLLNEQAVPAAIMLSAYLVAGFAFWSVYSRINSSIQAKDQHR